MTVSTFVNPTLRALAQVVLYTEYDDNGVSLDINYDIKDFDEKSLEKLYAEFQQFVSEVESAITKKIGGKWECIDDFYDVRQPVEDQTEHDYILTRNHHGAGFWDGDWDNSVAQILTDAANKQGEFSAYVGDDKKIYIC
jgi:hypothetical protein